MQVNTEWTMPNICLSSEQNKKTFINNLNNIYITCTVYTKLS